MRFKHMSVSKCIGCGCDDFRACPSGCWWLRVDYVVRKGVCSECEDQVQRWDSGDRNQRNTGEAPLPG